jgi:hypothetical protein
MLTFVTLIQAYNKIMLVMGGAIFSLIGALIALYPVYIHYGARRYRGEVVGLRVDGGLNRSILWPVIAYTDMDGQRHEALSYTGSSQIAAVPGMPMDIMVKPGQPDRCASPSFGWTELLGITFLVPGILLAKAGLKDFPLNWLSILLVVGFIGFFGTKIFHRLHPLIAAIKGGDWRGRGEAAAQERAHWPSLAAPEIAERVGAQDLKTRRALRWVFPIGLALLAGGLWWGQSRMIFIGTAAVAEGRVVGHEWASGSQPELSRTGQLRRRWKIHHLSRRYRHQSAVLPSRRDGPGLL